MSHSSSSLSFPSPEDEDEGQFYSSVYDTSASFTMNPLSQHPPRTPHQSITSRATVYPSVGDLNEEEEETPMPRHKDEILSDDGTEGGIEVQAKANLVLSEEIWRDLFVLSNGRDKAFKLIQYSLKMLLLVNRRVSIIPFGAAIGWRLEKTVAGLSFARKLMLLFNWLTPLTTVLKLQSASSLSSTKSSSPSPFLHTLLHAPPPVLLELLNAFADDLYAYSLLNLLPKRLGDKASRIADWCWFLTTIVGLVENAVERSMVGEVESRVYEDEMEGVQLSKKGGGAPLAAGKKPKVDVKEVRRLERKSYWLQVTRTKLILDLIFVSYDLWRINPGKDVVKTFCGLGAAVLSSMKLVDKQRSILANKA